MINECFHHHLLGRTITKWLEWGRMSLSLKILGTMITEISVTLVTTWDMLPTNNCQSSRNRSKLREVKAGVELVSSSTTNVNLEQNYQLSWSHRTRLPPLSETNISRQIAHHELINVWRYYPRAENSLLAASIVLRVILPASGEGLAAARSSILGARCGVWIYLFLRF